MVTHTRTFLIDALLVKTSVPPPHTTVAHVRAITGIAASEKQDRDIATLIEYAWREIRARLGITFDGVADKEYVGTSDGRDPEYRTTFHPILDKVEDAGGVTTNDSSKIRVYTVDPAYQDTYTLISSTKYLLHGDDGRIIFKSTAIPTDDFRIYVDYKYSADAIRHFETLLTSYYVFESMPNSQERAMEYLKRFEMEIGRLYPILNDNV